MINPEQQEQVIRLLAQTQERLQRYVLILIPDWDSAQEVVQNTHVVVWRKSGEFTSGGPEEFYRWMKQIAFFEAKKYLAKQAARPTLLDPDLAAMISDEFHEMDAELDAQRQVLSHCIEKLAPKDQQLLQQRYWSEDSVATLAQQFERTVDAIYKSLQRIRRLLLGCIEREARRGES